MNSKIRKIAAWALVVIVALIFIASALLKLFGGEASVGMAKFLGGMENLQVLAALELIIVALFIFPRTAVVGTLLMIAYFGGVIAVGFVNHHSVITPIIVESLIWISAAVRFPELTQRLFDSKQK